MLRFVGIGAQKSGTTWLYEWMRRHPEINFPQVKEHHYWDRFAEQGPIPYANLFPGPGVEGEITPAYGFLPLEIIRVIRAAFPDLRLFYIMRNPIDRAWSAAVMGMRREGRSFEETGDDWFLDNFRSSASLARGDYEMCVRNWRLAFGDQLHLAFFDDVLLRPVDVLAGIFSHIGVDPAPAYGFDPAELRARVFEGGSGPVRPSLLPALHALYDSKIVSLGAFLDRDLSAWRR